MTINCKICNAAATVRGKVNGYVAGTEFEVAVCENCGASFALPQCDATPLYDVIYSNLEYIPGYVRYAEYAHEVTTVAEPLNYLADREECYWGVREVLRAKVRRSDKIVEIGSGLGYLTYALYKAGYDVQAIDASGVAIEAARKRYGPMFERAEVSQYARDKPCSADVIILTEVIEHVTDPKSFLSACLPILRPGGIIVVTTPNRSVYPSTIVWESELPPIHWWWFAEKSIEELGRVIGCTAEFIDYSAFNTAKRRFLQKECELPIRRHILEEGPRAPVHLRVQLSRSRKIVRRLGAIKAVRELYRVLHRGRLLGSAGFTVCAVLKCRPHAE